MFNSVMAYELFVQLDTTIGNLLMEKHAFDTKKIGDITQSQVTQ